MALTNLAVFVLRSIILGLIMAGCLLLLIPGLREGHYLLDSWWSNSPASATRETYFNALSRSAPAVVNIYSVSIESDSGLFRNLPRERTNLGSGVIMTENGYVLTCHHVVKDADSIFVAVQDGRILEAQIVGTDPLTDLAVLKVYADNLHVMPQTNAPDIHVGDVVMAIGNPYDLGQTITHGIVSRAGRNGLSNWVDYIQTDAVLNQGNSGGALVDSNGVLVGITNANFQVLDGRRRVRAVSGIYFAVPYELAKRVMDEIITNGKVTRGQLGFEGREYPGRPGIEVTAVARNSPVDKAGIEAGDIILAIDGIRLESAAKTLDMIAETPPGTELKLEISRSGATITIAVVVAELRIN